MIRGVRYVHTNLIARDWRSLARFYQELFGWERGEAHDMGPMGVYQIFARAGKQLGGMYNKPASMSVPPHWLTYISVADIRAAAEAVKAAGGTVVNGPMEVPGGDWILQALDPQGAAFALHMAKSSARAAARHTRR